MLAGYQFAVEAIYNKILQRPIGMNQATIVKRNKDSNKVEVKFMVGKLAHAILQVASFDLSYMFHGSLVESNGA